MTLQEIPFVVLPNDQPPCVRGSLVLGDQGIERKQPFVPATLYEVAMEVIDGGVSVVRPVPEDFFFQVDDQVRCSVGIVGDTRPDAGRDPMEIDVSFLLVRSEVSLQPGRIAGRVGVDPAGFPGGLRRGVRDKGAEEQKKAAHVRGYAFVFSRERFIAGGESNMRTMGPAVGWCAFSGRFNHAVGVRK